MTLTEKYRPKSWPEVIAQDKAVRVLARMERTGGFGGRSFYIAGKSGTGKTTLARIIAGHVADPANVTEVVARQLTVNGLREMAFQWHYVAMGDKPGYALIVNEAHGMSKPVIEVFLDILEGLKSNVTIIFTTTNEGADLFEEHIDAGPFASRCHCLKLTNQGLSPKFAARLREIAQAEGLDGQPESEYLKLVNRCGQNFRDCLNRIESGEMLD